MGGNRERKVFIFIINLILVTGGADYTNSEIGVAQGYVLSPILMNVILHCLDPFSTGLCNEMGIRYVRFCDDTTIATMENSNIAAWDIIETAEVSERLIGIYIFIFGQK